MEKIELEQITRWAWECPQCGYYNVEDMLDNIVECESCCREYEVD